MLVPDAQRAADLASGLALGAHGPDSGRLAAVLSDQLSCRQLNLDLFGTHFTLLGGANHPIVAGMSFSAHEMIVPHS